MDNILITKMCNDKSRGGAALVTSNSDNIKYCWIIYSRTFLSNLFKFLYYFFLFEK